VRPVSLPKWPHPLLRDPPCPGRQVGEGVSPTLDARANMAEPPYQVEQNIHLCVRYSAVDVEVLFGATQVIHLVTAYRALLPFLPG
jgi:hypothetical protein